MRLEIKRKMFSKYQLLISDFKIFLLAMLKNWCLTKKSMCFVMKIYNFIYLRVGLKLKKIHGVFEFNQSQWFKPYVAFNSQKWKQKKMLTKTEKRCKNNEQCCLSARIYLLKVSKKSNSRTRCEICSKLTLKAPERYWHRSGVFIVDFEHTSHLAPLFLLLTLNM